MTFKKLLLSALILTGIQATLCAQVVQFTKPSWWFGGAAAANFNFYGGSTQKLNSDITAPVPFHQGNGVGLYLAPLVEYHQPYTLWGLMLQAGYDSKRGTFDEVFSPCNCPRNLATRLSYFAVEPSLRMAPFKSNLYFYVGPRVAFNLKKSFVYQQGTNPAYPEQVPEPDVKGDFSDMSSTLISWQIGAGYDIPVSSQNMATQFVVSPFISFQPYLGQSPRVIETWTVTTLRAGVALKFGRGTKIPAPAEAVKPAPPETIVSDPKVRFTVHAPKNIPAQRQVRETFPLRNYVFFDLGSTEVPDRYVLLKKEQVKDFKEEQVELFTPKNLSGRSERQMVVYYNILNILGDRMGKNPSATIRLVGSSEKGPEDGRTMAESIKTYLVNIFGIDGARITTSGRDKPVIPSEQPGANTELDLLRQGDRRVSIESGSPVMLMEFQSGPDAPLKPVEIRAVQDAPLESYVTFNVEGANEALLSWSLEIKDEAEKVQYFGPSYQEEATIPGKSILGTRPEGTYKVTMIGQTKSGKTIRQEKTVHMVLWTPPVNEEVMRFSVIYEFDESKAIAIYEKYLTEIVVPKIQPRGTVIIHGYTDMIGEEAYNHKLSHARANDVKTIMENGLAKAGRKDVKFEVYGFGEDPKLTPFENRFPEERFYNRTVLIDLIPAH